MPTTPEYFTGTPGGTGVIFHDFEPAQESFLDAVIAGLSQPQRAIPCRFLYDEQGSRLFAAICRQPEYYPTRTELRILRRNAAAIAEHVGAESELIELGSGSSDKVQLLLDTLALPAAYVPIDISREQLLWAARRIAALYPGVEVHAICADYASDFPLPAIPQAGRRLAFYPGSTISNFTPAAAERFLSNWAGRLGAGAMMLIGVDLTKSGEILDAAYNDAAGVTAQFSLNLLARANREVGADFDLAGFAHEARYLSAEGRVEIHLRALKAQMVTIAGRRFSFAQGERIHIEDSWKYAIDDFRALALRAGYSPVGCWTDPERLFSVHLLAVRS